MTCSAVTQTCECVPEGNTPEAMALCNGTTGDPMVVGWCAGSGGCETMLCGAPFVPKAPYEWCKYGGEVKPDANDPSTWIPVWCCVAPCESADDCNDGNDCTVNECNQGHCAFANGPEVPCNDNLGTCIEGVCVPN
jgi:hypothetical protein